MDVLDSHKYVFIYENIFVFSMLGHLHESRFRSLAKFLCTFKFNLWYWLDFVLQVFRKVEC